MVAEISAGNQEASEETPCSCSLQRFFLCRSNIHNIVYYGSVRVKIPGRVASAAQSDSVGEQHTECVVLYWLVFISSLSPLQWLIPQQTHTFRNLGWDSHFFFLFYLFFFFAHLYQSLLTAQVSRFSFHFRHRSSHSFSLLSGVFLPQCRQRDGDFIYFIFFSRQPCKKYTVKNVCENTTELATKDTWLKLVM